jgi:hypothetical protein
MPVRRLVVAVVAVAIMALPAVAGAATIRVTSAKAPLLGNLEWESGSVRSYADAKGKAHPLKARTALGQLVAATAFTDTALTIDEFAGLGAYVSSIGGIKMGPKANWNPFVNGRLAQVGAGSLKLKRSDRVVWLLDDNWGTKKTFALDIVATWDATVPNATVTVTVTRFGDMPKPKPAVGAQIMVDGVQVATTDAEGKATITPTGDWDVLQAKQAGAIDSQLILE